MKKSIQGSGASYAAGGNHGGGIVDLIESRKL